jgi:hypothetical protein
MQVTSIVRAIQGSETLHGLSGRGYWSKRGYCIEFSDLERPDQHLFTAASGKKLLTAKDAKKSRKRREEEQRKPQNKACAEP